MMLMAELCLHRGGWILLEASRVRVRRILARSFQGPVQNFPSLEKASRQSVLVVQKDTRNADYLCRQTGSFRIPQTGVHN